MLTILQATARQELSTQPTFGQTCKLTAIGISVVSMFFETFGHCKVQLNSLQWLGGLPCVAHKRRGQQSKYKNL
jgi:hypothetical protein